MPVTYQCAFSGQLAPVNNFMDTIIVPLTCGPNPSLQHGDTPISNLRAITQTLTWDPIFQGATAHPGSLPDNTTPQWLKFYKQSFTLRFHSGTLNNANRITVSVIRVNPKLITTVKQTAARCDSREHSGPEPTLETQSDYIAPGQDYASSPGLIFGTPTSGGVPPIPADYSAGAQNIYWNKALWICDYQKSIDLGVALNPQRAAENPPTLQSRPAFDPNQFAMDDSRFSETCKFSINYGGMKLTGVPDDSDAIVLDRMDATQVKYSDIPPEHKRWLVIHQSNPPHINADGDAPQYAAHIQMNSVLSARAPA